METIVWGLITGFIGTTGLAIFFRLFPKEKAIKVGENIADFLGAGISAFGNSKFGKKLWNPVEEGPIVTICALFAAMFNRLPNKITEDNKVE